MERNKNSSLRQLNGENCSTIEELERWLEENLYSFNEISIGKHHAPEGHVIKVDYDKYIHCYSERGNKRMIKAFDSEKELVDYAYHMFQADKWNQAYMLAFSFDIDKINR